MSDNSNEISIVITATDKASQTLALVQKSLTFITTAVGNVTKAYVAYGDQVTNLSRFIGINTEQSSRLIQVADDAFVSYDTLRLAAKNLSEKGFQPNIEMLGKLSDEYLKLNPGLERSQYLVDKFGRSGMEMSKIMELGSAKLAEMNQNIEAGLIIDDQKAANILKMKQAQDAFNDSMDAVKYEWADKLLTTFQALPKPMQDVVLTLGVVGQSGMLNSMAQLAILVGQIAKGGGAASAISGIGASADVALAPIAALAGALMLLYYVWQKYGAQVQTTLNQASIIVGHAIGVDNETLKKAINGPEIPYMGKPTGAGQAAPQGLPSTNWDNYVPPNTNGMGTPWGGAPLPNIIVNNNGISLGNQAESRKGFDAYPRALVQLETGNGTWLNSAVSGSAAVRTLAQLLPLFHPRQSPL